MHYCWRRCWRRGTLRLNLNKEGRATVKMWTKNFWIWWRAERMKRWNRSRRRHWRGSWWGRTLQKTWGTGKTSQSAVNRLQLYRNPKTPSNTRTMTIIWLLFVRIKENELAREQKKLEKQKEGKEIQRLQALHQLEQRMEAERRENQKRNLRQAHLVGSRRHGSSSINLIRL